MTASAFLDDLLAAARQAEAAEGAFRREVTARIVGLERERAFAFRRFNLMKSVVEAVGSAEDESTAVAYGGAALRAKLGWDSDSEARVAVVESFTPVSLAVFASLAPDRQKEQPDVGAALAQFETWYAQNHTTPFWALFEHYIPDTPLVDF